MEIMYDFDNNCGIMEGNSTTSSLGENEVKMYNKLVTYSSSSESENHDSERKSPHNTKKLKRFDSDYSFYEEKDSDDFYSSSDSEQLKENYTNTVGEAGLKKRRKISKKNIKEREKTLGRLKSVQENPCQNKRCQNACARKQERHDIFEYFWRLSTHQSQREWLLSGIKKRKIRRRVINTENSRRNRTFKYFITWNGIENEGSAVYFENALHLANDFEVHKE
ncbi:hypothetical protein JTB14_023973 [Gonioctena quinquepunctata]|nr:hypothetical protein JTB14_023973 [Gonioctena quinquepunctata]